MKKYALVLSGGGFKGSFQVGALQYIRDNWEKIAPGNKQMKFDIVAGVSVGSLNGALIAAGEFEELEKLWSKAGSNVEEIYTSEFIDTKDQSQGLKFRINFEMLLKRFGGKISTWDKLGLIFSQSKRQKLIDRFASNFKQFKSIADNTPLKQKLDNLVSIGKIKNCIYKCGFVSLDSGSYISRRHTDFKTDEDLRKAILASTAMPIVWKPVEEINWKPAYEGESGQALNSVDGGVRNVSPLGDVIDEIGNEDYLIIIINCNSGKVNEKKFADSNIAGIALRSLVDISITEIFNSDLSEFLRINKIVEQAQNHNPPLEIRNYDYLQDRLTHVLKPFKCIVITPTWDLGDPLVSTTQLYNDRVKHGMEQAKVALDNYTNTGHTKINTVSTMNGVDSKHTV